jgi:hypothetical protein
MLQGELLDPLLKRPVGAGYLPWCRRNAQLLQCKRRCKREANRYELMIRDSRVLES